MNGLYFARALAIVSVLSFSGCYFNQACPQDLFDQTAHKEQACVAATKKQKDLETLLLLSIVTGGFPGSPFDSSNDADGSDEDGGTATGGD